MSSTFKEKDTRVKKAIRKPQSNLLTLHDQWMKKFDTEEREAQSIKRQIEEVESRLCELGQVEKRDFDTLRMIAELQDTRKELEKQLASILNHENMMEYYFRTYGIISDYYTLEHEPPRAQVSITNFFMPKTGDHDSSLKNNKRELLELYLNCSDDTYVSNKTTKVFNFCNDCKQDMVIKKQQGIYICTSCGVTYDIPIDLENHKSTNATTETTKYSVYQRKNHFKEWLNQIQARETTDIPPEVFDLIKIELNKIRFYNLAELEPDMIRRILKKLNLSRYYENTFHIIYRLNGLQPPTLSREMEDKLLFYFKQIEEPFKLYKKKNRKNILRYSYILYKLCELLELDSLLPCFKLLKNRYKLMEQDVIWQAICQHLGWEFIPSL